MSLWKLLGIEHVAELRGERVTFYSAGRRGSHELWSDAVQACKEADIYESINDGGKVRIDGETYKNLRWD